MLKAGAISEAAVGRRPESARIAASADFDASDAGAANCWGSLCQPYLQSVLGFEI